MRTLYLKPELCPITWRAPQPLAATRLLAELIAHLSDAPLEPAERSRAEAVLLDLLQPVATTTIEVTMPTDERALDVARALLADPGTDAASPSGGGRWARSSRRFAARPGSRRAAISARPRPQGRAWPGLATVSG